VRQREDVSESWRARLAEFGLDGLGQLLDQAPESGRLVGRWLALSKPGLGHRQRWRWQLPDGEASAVIYVKRYARTPLREQWDRIRRQTLHRSRAWWEYRQAQRLAAAQISVPNAIGFVERMQGAWEQASAVLLAAVPGDGLDRVWTRLERQNAPLTRGIARHDLTVRLARFVAAFHQTGFCHRDLYLCHVFADLDPDGVRPPRFSLIDLARTYRPRWRRTRWLIKDLAQLDASARPVGATRTDRWRFLLAYLGLEPRAARARWYARRIVRKSDRILRREARRSRPQ